VDGIMVLVFFCLLILSNVLIVFLFVEYIVCLFFLGVCLI
jgi:hypothetical protein